MAARSARTTRRTSPPASASEPSPPSRGRRGFPDARGGARGGLLREGGRRRAPQREDEGKEQDGLQGEERTDDVTSRSCGPVSNGCSRGRMQTSLRSTSSLPTLRLQRCNTQRKNALQESREMYQELQKQNSSLQETLQKVEAEKMDVLKSLGDEEEAKIAVESSRNEISEDLRKAKLEEKRLNDQVKMLQDTNKRLQEYNTSLQQYNCNLQADATKNGDTIAKLQKEKNTTVETMNGLKDHVNSVKSSSI